MFENYFNKLHGNNGHGFDLPGFGQVVSLVGYSVFSPLVYLFMSNGRTLLVFLLGQG
jgi:hypothetical protein